MKRVIVIGGTNYDLLAYSHHQIKINDSNPGYIESSFGGVGRNIAENLAKLDLSPLFITVVGSDYIGDQIVVQGKKVGIKFSVIESRTTPVYLAVHNTDKNMFVAISATDEMELLTVEQIKKRYQLIAASDLIILDANLSYSVLDYVFNEFDNPICIDVVSTKKAEKVIPFYQSIQILKMNKLEAQSLSNIKGNKKEDVKQMGKYFIYQGVKQVFITLGAKGAYYYNGSKHVFSKEITLAVENTTGSGDAFFSGVIYAKLNDLPLLTYGITAAIINVKAKNTVAHQMSLKKLKQTIKEYDL